MTDPHTRPAPQHSVALNRMLGISDPRIRPDDIPVTDQRAQHRAALRRAAVQRSRRRRALNALPNATAEL